MALTGRREKAGIETAKLVESAGGKALFIRADVHRESDCERAVSETLKKFGRLDYALNNAGIEGKPGPLTEMTQADFDDVIQVNVRGVFLSMKYEICAMFKSGGGR